MSCTVSNKHGITTISRDRLTLDDYKFVRSNNGRRRLPSEGKKKAAHADFPGQSRTDWIVNHPYAPSADLDDMLMWYLEQSTCG